MRRSLFSYLFRIAACKDIDITVIIYMDLYLPNVQNPFLYCIHAARQSSIRKGVISLSIRIHREDGIVCRVPNSAFGYFGWPSIARMEDGTLAVAASGPRHTHICPWGKDSVTYSYDYGRTWTEPDIVQDSPLDDRDAGIISLGGKALLLTWFTLDPRQFRDRFWEDMDEHMARWADARLSTLSDAAVRRNAGSWT